MSELCGHGLHDMSDPANVYVRPNGKGRQCKPCLYIRNRANQARYARERRADSALLEASRRYHREWMKRKRDKDPEYRERQLALTRKLKAERRAMVSMLKLERGCIDCGYHEDASLLQLDHRDPATKGFTVSMNLLKPMEELMAEIAKCDVRCVWCHSSRTSREGHAVNRRYQIADPT